MAKAARKSSANAKSLDFALEKTMAARRSKKNSHKMLKFDRLIDRAFNGSYKSFSSVQIGDVKFRSFGGLLFARAPTIPELAKVKLTKKQCDRIEHHGGVLLRDHEKQEIASALNEYQVKVTIKKAQPDRLLKAKVGRERLRNRKFKIEAQAYENLLHAAAVDVPKLNASALRAYEAARDLAIVIGDTHLEGAEGRPSDGALNYLIIQLAEIFVGAGGTPHGRKANEAKKSGEPRPAPFVRFVDVCLELTADIQKRPEIDELSSRVRKLDREGRLPKRNRL